VARDGQAASTRPAIEIVRTKGKSSVFCVCVCVCVSDNFYLYHHSMNGAKPIVLSLEFRCVIHNNKKNSTWIPSTQLLLLIK
jgi:hypothetical protein